MKTQLPFLVTTFLLTGYAPIKEVQANQPVQIAQSTWKLFSSSEGGFRILMPGTPDAYHSLVGFPYIGDLVPIHTYVVRKGLEPGYWVGYLELPHKISNSAINQVLTQCLDYAVMLSARGEKLLSQRTISLGNYPGKEFRYKSHLAVPITVIARAYLVEQRCYLIGAETTNERNQTRIIEDFLNSFQLLK